MIGGCFTPDRFRQKLNVVADRVGSSRADAFWLVRTAVQPVPQQRATPCDAFRRFLVNVGFLAVTLTRHTWRGTISAIPPLPRRQVVQALGRLGWATVVQRGSHAQLKHATGGDRVTVPLHSGEIIGPGLLRAILAQAGVTAEEFRAAL